MNRFTKIAFLNIAIVVITVIGYSPGLLNLRPGDPSILKAGISIILGIALIAGFIFGNYRLLLPEKRQIYTKESVVDVTKAVSILEKYKNDKYVGQIAKTAIEQIDRLNRSTQRAEMEIKAKFGDSALSYDKYHAVIDSAGAMALENLVSLANRLQLYDTTEYERLKDYKNDDIPDDIQEKQLKLFERNKELASNAINANENLILSLDTLAIELTSANYDAENSGDSLLNEIEALTDEVKYYI